MEPRSTQLFDGNTPLMFTAHAGHFSAVQFLAANKADLDARNINDEQAFELANRSDENGFNIYTFLTDAMASIEACVHVQNVNDYRPFPANQMVTATVTVTANQMVTATVTVTANQMESHEQHLKGSA